MTRRTATRAFTHLARGAACLLLLVSACGDDEEPAEQVALDPPELALRELVLPGREPIPLEDSESAVEVELGCDYSLAVIVDLDNWTLRPEGACAGAAQCGHLRLSVEPRAGGDAVSAVSAARLVPLPTMELPDSGVYQLEVGLRNDDGSAFLDEDGDPVTASQLIELTLATDCESGQGGAAGAPSAGAAGHAGEAGQAGQGGAGAGGGAGMSGAGAGGLGASGMGGAGAGGLGEAGMAGAGTSGASSGGAGAAGEAGQSGNGGAAG